MGKFKVIGLVLLISLTSVLSEASKKEEVIESPSEDLLVAKVEETPLQKDEKEPINQEDLVFKSLRPLRGEANRDIIISKDNLVPFLKTILLGVTHKKDPTYTEIVKLSGKSLLKMAEKKIGSDKYMGGLLSIIKKYVENFDMGSVSDEDQEILGELAEEYLKKHKFEVFFPESLLLHQPEMESFVAKKKELGLAEGRQLALDFTPYFSTLSNFTSNLRAKIAEIPFFKSLNLDRIGTTFDNIGTTVNEYLPSIRQGAGLPDIGISVGSLSALAAVGALISAPFFLYNFGESDEEENSNDIFYNNRRASPGGVPYQQLLNPPQINNGGMVVRPQWFDQYEKDNGLQYGASAEPVQQSQNYGIPAYQEPKQGSMSNEEYEKYLSDYNNYYIKYKEWYRDYYTQQFGESPPPHQQSIAPNAYSEVNTIPGMQPPPPQQIYQQQGPVTQQEPTSFYQGNSRYPEGAENENQSFQVIHVDEAERRAQQNSGNIQQNQIHSQQPEESYNQQQQEAYSQQQQEAYNQQQQEAYNQQQQESYNQQQQEAYNKQQQEAYTQQQQEAYDQQQQEAYNQQQQEAYNQQQTESYQQQQEAYQQQVAAYQESLIQQQQQEVFKRQQEAKNQQQFNQQTFSRPDSNQVQNIRPNQQASPSVPSAEPIPQASSLISQAVPLFVSLNHQGDLLVPPQQPLTSPRPIYTPNEPTMAHGGFHPIAENEQQFVVVSKPKETINRNPAPVAVRKDVVEIKPQFVSDFREVKPGSKLEVREQASDIPVEAFTFPSTKISSVTSGIFKTSPEPTPKAATTPKPKYYKKPYNKSVRVVTSKSIVTSAPQVKPEEETSKPEEITLKKRKITLPELLQQSRGDFSAPEIAIRNKEEPKYAGEEVQASEKVFTAVAQPRSESEPIVAVEPVEVNEVPIYAMDPFYGPRLSRTDSIFSQLHLTSEGCREQVVCNMYRNPHAFTPLSDFLSRQLTVTYDQLKRPTINDPKILRFFNYLQAARAGQDGFDCLEKYSKCPTDTMTLSYKPIVDAHKKVSVLMKASSS